MFISAEENSISFARVAYKQSPVEGGGGVTRSRMPNWLRRRHIKNLSKGKINSAFTMARLIDLATTVSISGQQPVAMTPSASLPNGVRRALQTTCQAGKM